MGKNMVCFCGCDSFSIAKHRHQWELICRRCSCRRRITTPGIGVRNYDVSVPFAEDEEAYEEWEDKEIDWPEPSGPEPGELLA